MLIKKKSLLSGIEHEMEINVTPDQLKAWNDGMVIQRAMPNLTSEEREFIMTGITKEEWDTVYPPKEE